MRNKKLREELSERLAFGLRNACNQDAFSISDYETVNGVPGKKDGRLKLQFIINLRTLYTISIFTAA